MSASPTPLPRALLVVALWATAATGQELGQSHEHRRDADNHAHHQPATQDSAEQHQPHRHEHQEHAGHAEHRDHAHGQHDSKDPPEPDHDRHAEHDHADHSNRDAHAGHEHHDQDSHAHHTGHDDHAEHADHAEHDDHAAHDEHHAHHGHHAEPDHLPREPIPPLTDADRAAAFPALHHHMEHPPEMNFRVLFDRFEWQDADGGSAFAWENKTWIGSDMDRLWIRSGGERTSGRTHAANVELLYGRSVSAWWDVVGGIRHEFRPGPSRSWAAVGIQGLAPYWFEVSATAYLGEGGHVAASVEVEYELLLTNRLILQPVLELELHGKDDPARGIGAGLSSVEAGLRLRYEVSRRFAPYLGVTSERLYGDTARMHRQAGGDGRETRLVAGIRWWF